MWPTALLLFLSQPAAAFVLFSPWGSVEQNGYTSPYVDRTGSTDWLAPNSFHLYQSVFLWGSPANVLSQEGLGGGITWALHPNFCEDILPYFPEASRAGTFATFVTCDDLRHKVTSAFNTWAMNHELISFHDVTERCTDMNGTHCPAAEIVITTYQPQNRYEAMVTKLDSDAIDFSPRLTSGVNLPHGLGVRRAWINVSTASCWYADETFCYSFHRWHEEHDIDIDQLVTIICACTIAIAAFMLLSMFLSCCLAVCGFDKFTPNSQLQEYERVARAARRKLRTPSFPNPTKRSSNNRPSQQQSPQQPPPQQPQRAAAAGSANIVKQPQNRQTAPPQFGEFGNYAAVRASPGGAAAVVARRSEPQATTTAATPARSNWWEWPSPPNSPPSPAAAACGATAGPPTLAVRAVV